MKRSSRLALVVASLALVLQSTASTAAAESARRPNLVFVFPDQMRGQAMGFLGQEPVVTPNLDRFAQQSLVLTQAVSNYPVCSPYRAMLMTGKYPHANGVLSNCTSRTAAFDNQLRQTDRCWSDVLADRGYSLGYIGKWHLDAPHKPYVESYNNSEKFAWNEWCPPERRHGFDFWYAYGTFDRHLTPEYWSTDMKRHERVKVQQWGPEHETDLAIKYITNAGGTYRKPDRPFALVMSMNPPHTPYQLVPKKYLVPYADKTTEQLITRDNVNLQGDSRGAKIARAQIKNYFAMITGVDDQFGRILRALAEAGLDKDTIVVFTSDHGNCLGSHDHSTKNVHYEESLIVPFLIRWPGNIAPRRDDLLLSTPDIYPTLLDLMGLKADIPATVGGVSHAQLFRTGNGPRPSSAMYLWIPPERPELGRRGVRTDRYTLMIEKTPDAPPRHTLHDNRDDPFQLQNLADEQPELVDRLTREELVPWLKKTRDPWLGEKGK
ncbi:MAG: sulfatase [Planctomycetes bacterium]|nr:sulfatase [Planctomycetota bacterium]